MDDLSRPPTAPDSLDMILRQAVSAPAVLLPGAMIGERYRIERMLGMGGMGTVYLARDLELDRAVAIKVHRLATDSARLRREAVAMARLAHPNVVAVFEVGDYEGHPFVAMEYVDGETLRAWLAATRRSRSEILEVLLAAGAGLAAAHAAELVHRDIKPDNILMGRDGRVRVGDFGLAQVAEAGTPLRVPIDDMTATGTVIGTPAYMAPEQIDGGVVDVRSDQFAFCVAAWEALFGARPFTGEDTLELRAAIERGVPVPVHRYVPARLRQVLLRGLAFDPAKRWPSLPVLLRALRSARLRRRVTIAALAAVALAAPIATWATWPGPDPTLACDARASMLDVMYPRMQSAALVAAVRGSGGAHAGEFADALGRGLDDRYARAERVTLNGCRARAIDTWSAQMAGASQECVADNSATARAMFDAASPTRATMDLLLFVTSVPEVEPCGDARVLAGWRPLASSPEELAAVLEARATIARARVEIELERISVARGRLEALARTPIGAHPSVRGRAELLRGELEIANGDYAVAEHRFEEAYFAARTADDTALVLLLVRELIYVTTTNRRDTVAGERWVRDGLADAEREGLHHPQAAAQILIAAASAASLAGDSELALKRCDRADAMAASIDPRLRSQETSIRSGALADLGRTAEALAVSDRDLARTRYLLGGSHPNVATVLGDRAALLLDAGRKAEGAAAAREAKQIMDSAVELAIPSIVPLEITIGATLLNVGDPAGARYLEHAREARVADFGEDHPDVALIDTNLALVYLDAGDTQHALSVLRHAIVVQERTLGPEHLELAVGLYNLAVAERDFGTFDVAVTSAERAVQILDRRQHGSARHVFSLVLVADIENRAGRPDRALAAAKLALDLPPVPDEATGLAWAQLETAKALIALHREPARTRQLLHAARIAYDGAELPERIAEIDALATKVP